MFGTATVILFDNIARNQTMKNAENSNCLSSNGYGPTLTTMTKLSAGWPATLTQLSAGFSATLALELLSFSLSYLLTARDGPVFFLGPCQVLVVQSFAFSLEQSQVVD